MEEGEGDTSEFSLLFSPFTTHHSADLILPLSQLCLLKNLQLHTNSGVFRATKQDEKEESLHSRMCESLPLTVVQPGSLPMTPR